MLETIPEEGPAENICWMDENNSPMASASTLLKTAAFTALVPVVVAIAIPQLLVARRPHPKLPIDRTVGRLLGTPAIATGVAIYLHTALGFAEGGGTPYPRAEPDELVTGGLYDHTRNPMYLGVLLVILGQALLYRSVAVAWWAAGCWIGFHNRVIEYEEPHLAEKHGDAYDEYRERVPRWVPRTGPWR